MIKTLKKYILEIIPFEEIKLALLVTIMFLFTISSPHQSTLLNLDVLAYNIDYAQQHTTWTTSEQLSLTTHVARAHHRDMFVNLFPW